MQSIGRNLHIHLFCYAALNGVNTMILLYIHCFCGEVKSAKSMLVGMSAFVEEVDCRPQL